MYLKPVSTCLQVTWDEPDLLQNVKRVSPWLVELVSNMPVIHLSPFSPPRKKLRLPQQLDYPLDGQFSMLSSFSGNPLGSSSPLCCLSDNTPAGIQGARHAQFGTSLSDFHVYNKLQSGLFMSNFQRFNPQSRISDSNNISNRTNSNDNLSCLLTVGNSSQNLEKSDNVKKQHQFVLFGQPILTEQQITRSCSSDAVSQVGKNSSDEISGKVNASSDGSGITRELQISPQKSSSPDYFWNRNSQTTEPGLDTGHCKVFLESEDVGRTLDLSVLSTYEELHRKLANMFGIERSDLLNHVLYQDATNAVKRIGDQPFRYFIKLISYYHLSYFFHIAPILTYNFILNSDFLKKAKRLTILMGSGGDNVRR